MTTQPEQILENNLVEQLQKLGYIKVIIKDEKDLLANLKSQLEIHNKIELSANDFKQILNYINKGNIFERAKILRDRVPFTDDDGEHKTIELLIRFNGVKINSKLRNKLQWKGNTRIAMM